MNARPRVLLAAAITLWLAVPAAAARVVQVRVGEHPGFTRIVFELDAPAGYQLERKSGAAELTVTLEASSEARKVTRKSWDIRSVDVAAAQRAVAKIRLANPGLQLKEMILSNPPRIVLDVLREKPVVASAKQAVKQAAPRAEAKLAPPRPEDSQPAVPKTPKAAKTEVVAPSAPKPAAQPTPVADAKPATATKPVDKTEPAPAPKPTAKPSVPATPIAKTEPAPAPKTEAKPAAVPKPAAETKPVADAKPPAPAVKPVADAKPPAPAPTVKPVVEKSIADTKSAAKPAETPPVAPKPAEMAKPPADAKAAAPKAEPPTTPSADAKASTTPAESKPIAEAAKPAAPPTPPGAKPVMTASDLTKLVAEQLAQKDKQASSRPPATPPAPATAATPAAKPVTPPPSATTQIDAKQPAPPPSKTAEAKPPAPVTPIAPPAEVKLPAPVPPPAAEIAKPAPSPAPAPAVAELAKPAPAPAPIEVAKPAPPPPPVAPVPAPKPAAKPEAVAKPAAAKPADTAQSGGGLLSSPLLLGAAAGVLLCVVGLVLVLRRRRALPNDLDVTAIAEARDDAEGAAYGTSNASTEDDSYSLFEGDDSTSAQATAPALRNTAPAASDADEASFASLFDEEDAHGTPVSQGAATMNQPTSSDFPMDRASSDRTAATVATPRPASAAPGADVMRLVQDLERRMGMLEKKLGEANDAREKLERQVAAQSEELRVQRAAIARTQRALRTMTRGEEDKATEPALREDPSGQTQSKTRINL